MPSRVILLIVLLGLGAAAAQEPTADGDTNGDGVVDAAEERAQQQLHDSLVQAAALMEHGSATAKEAATEEIARMAIITTIDQPFHPVTYRNAAIKAGIVELLVALLSPTADATAAAQRNALAALEAIATDDPTTDLDNDHARYVCDAGAVQHVVRLLSSPQEQLQVQSAACAAILAESVPCQTALSAAKAEVPLVQLGTFGNDVAKLHALAALEQMALNNPLARERIAKGGGLEMLHGVGGFGSGSDLRDAAADFARGLEASDETVQVAVDIRSHARRAHETRLKHSKIFQNHVGVARSYATPSPRGVPGDSRAECIKWAQEGECGRNPGFMLENCARSCAGHG